MEQLPFLALMMMEDDTLCTEGKYLGTEHSSGIFVVIPWFKSHIQGQILRFI